MSYRLVVRNCGEIVLEGDLDPLVVISPDQDPEHLPATKVIEVGGGKPGISNLTGPWAKGLDMVSWSFLLELDHKNRIAFCNLYLTDEGSGID